MKKYLATSLALVATLGTGFGAISITSDSFTYSQNFNSLATSGTANSWSNNSTVAGWSLFNSTSAAITTYRASPGSDTAGAFYSFGSASSSDRALGGLGSGGTYFGSPLTNAVAGYIAVAFTNATVDEVDTITISFDGEQWRNGGNVTAQTMAFEWGIGSTFSAVTTWTAPGGAFNWSSPVATASGAAVDGNVAGLVTGRGGELTDLGLGAGETLWFRWVELNDSGSDHGLAIDNFAVTSLTTVPEPGFALLGGLGILGIFRRRRF
jgi:hypothetical protein